MPELISAWRANKSNNLIVHLRARTKLASDKGAEFVGQARETVALLSRQLGSKNPRDAVPQLLTVVPTSWVVSGGPDADGGAPDLDLLFGIGWHRSIFTHSIVMGTALETAFLSLADLVRLVHGKLPPVHDPLWDQLANEAGTFARSASIGASLGMAYHLAADGTIQAGTYQDLPVEKLPEVVHHGISVVNSMAEAVDARGKPRPRQVTSLSEATKEERDAHTLYLRRQFVPNTEAAELLDAEQRSILEKDGCWMQALVDGTLAPLNDAHRRFLDVAAQRIEPATEHEWAWAMYSSVLQWINTRERRVVA